MDRNTTNVCFKARLQHPARPGKDGSWSFLVLPRSASGKLPRRGRTSVDGTVNGHRFRATLEPDGQLSHWLKISEELREVAGMKIGDTVTLEIASVTVEPELPSDFGRALAASPEAEAMWQATTTIARVDWIHWIESAKRADTRKSRITSACDMLAAGKKRVCCFDPSGFYSKNLKAPEAAGEND